MGRGDHPKTFSLKALFCQSTHSWLKLGGGWPSRLFAWPSRLYGGLWDDTVISWDFHSHFPFPTPSPSRLTKIWIMYFGVELGTWIKGWGFGSFDLIQDFASGLAIKVFLLSCPLEIAINVFPQMFRRVLLLSVMVWSCWSYHSSYCWQVEIGGITKTIFKRLFVCFSNFTWKVSFRGI